MPKAKRELDAYTLREIERYLARKETDACRAQTTWAADMLAYAQLVGNRESLNAAIEHVKRLAKRAERTQKRRGRA